MVTDGAPLARDLRDYLLVVARRKGLVVAVPLLLVLGSLAFSFTRTPVYAGRAEVLIEQSDQQALFDNNAPPATDPNRVIQTEIRIIESPAIRTTVRQAIGPVPKVSASPQGQTNVIQLRSESTNKSDAARAANAYATAYIDFRRNQAANSLLRGARQIQDKVAEYQSQIDSLPAGPQKDALIGQQALFKQRINELQVGAALTDGGVQIIAPAAVPSSPFKPKPLVTAVAFAAFGMLLSLSLAFLVDYLDDSVKTKDDVERAVPTAPVIGLIPTVTSWTDSGTAKVISMEEPMSPPAEAYRTLRAAIQFLALDRPVRTVLVTSPGAEEGKSTTLANLAVVLSRNGLRVIVASCDLRRPRIHEFFGLDNSVGFTSAYLSRTKVTDALQIVPGEPRLAVMASGPLPPNPAELLSSQRAADILGALREASDILLIDAPPLLPVSDALVLSRSVDATLVVCVAGSTTRKNLTRTVELLGHVEHRIVGTVLNGVAADGEYATTYYREQPRVGPRRSPLGARRNHRGAQRNPDDREMAEK